KLTGQDDILVLLGVVPKPRSQTLGFALVGPEQARMARDVIGPVPGHAALPLEAQRPAQESDQSAMSFAGRVLDLPGPQRQQARQVLPPVVGSWFDSAIAWRGPPRPTDGSRASSASPPGGH